jgi:hypothetical protein
MQEDEETLQGKLEELFDSARELDLGRTVEVLHEVVPEYQAVEHG